MIRDIDRDILNMKDRIYKDDSEMYKTYCTNCGYYLVQDRSSNVYPCCKCGGISWSNRKP